MKGKHFSEEGKRNISKAKKGTKCGWAITSKEMNERQKILKTGFYNSELQSELGKRGAKSFALYIKNKSKYKFENIGFYSKQEMEFAKFLLENKYLEKIEYGVNYNIYVERKIFDFLINDIYIEFHPIWSTGKDPRGRTFNEYYKQRRKVLNDNNINNKLIVVLSIKDFINNYSGLFK